MSDAAYLQPAEFVDSDHPTVKAFAESHAGQGDARERAVSLYYAIRDRIRYNPYSFSVNPESHKASHLLEQGEGYCVPKAIALAATARAQGIPARIGFADVKNHLASERLLQLMGSNVFRHHGYTELYLEGRWVKATPAFNVELCQRFGVKPLDFDGRQDALMHEFDSSGKRHMQYLADHGHRADLPFDELRTVFTRYYAPMLKQLAALESDARGDLINETPAS